MVARRASYSSPKNTGFIPLDEVSGGEMSDSGAIPLTTVRSNASMYFNHGNSTAADSNDEKAGHHSHLHFRHAGRRRKAVEQDLGRMGTGDEEVKLNTMGKFYVRLIQSSVLVRYFIYIAPIGLALAAPLIVLHLTGNRDTIPVGRKKHEDGEGFDQGPPLFDLLLWIQISWLSLWAGKIVAWFLPKVFMFVTGVVSAGTRKYATVLENMSIVLSIFFWALATWVTFTNLFRGTDDRIDWVRDVQRVFGALFVSSAVLLGEKAIVQLIGVSYHQRSFAVRIKESKREVHLLGILYDASRTLFPMYCREFADEDYVINDSIELMLRGKNARRGAGSATPMKLIGDVTRIGDKVTSAFGTIATEITGKKILNPNSAHSIVLGALEKVGPTEALARRIWMSFAVEGRDVLLLEDFEEVLGPAYKAEAEEAFNAIDSDINGDISLDEMIRKTVEIGKERKAIGEGMKDIGQALKAFDKVLLFVVLLIVIFIFLAFFQSSFVNVIASAGTALLSLSFIFAVTAQEFLGSCIFLFVKHPYDVGDRVNISDIQMVVERISLLYTVFTRLDTGQTAQTPNIVLNNLWVDNITRSKAMAESIQLEVSFDTSFEDVELLRLEMENFVRADDNSRDFQRDFAIGVGGVGSLDKLILNISIKHKSNWHNDAVRATRRSKFMCALALAIKKIPIYGPGGGGDALGGPNNPTYSVAVTNDFAAASREKASHDRQQGRMVPPPSYQSAEEAREAEEQAVSGINTRAPVAETAGIWDTPRSPLSPTDHPEDDVAARRSRDVESLRSELHKRESQRGRRRAGESLPMRTESNKGAPLAHTTSRLETFDEEAQTGMPSTFYAQNRPEASGSRLAPSASRRGGGLRPSPSQRSHRSQMSNHSYQHMADQE